MKPTVIIIALLLVATTGFAAETAAPAKAPGPNFERHRAEVISRIDARIASNQEEKNCVQAARNNDDIKVCRDRFKAEIRGQQQQMKK